MGICRAAAEAEAGGPPACMYTWEGGRGQGRGGEPVRPIRRNEEIRVKEGKVSKMACVSVQKPEGDLPFPLSYTCAPPAHIYIYMFLIVAKYI